MNKQQILFLRKKAQTLKSKFQIGKHQLNGTTLINLRNGLRVHELIKIHILKSAQQHVSPSLKMHSHMGKKKSFHLFKGFRIMHHILR
jgi:RNA-binding protein YhbY